MNTLSAAKSTPARKGHPHLLTALLLMVMVSPFLHQHVTYIWILAIVLVLVMLAAARTVARERHLFVVALVFGFPALISQIALLGVDRPWLELVRFSATALFLVWVCVLLLRDIVLRSHRVTLELILGAINVYLMIGLAFAYIYAMIEFLQPGSFTGLQELAAIPDRVLYFIYFSYITQSTLGYGDISPLTPHGMTTAYLQAIIGQLYLAILVARLVAVYIGHPGPDED